MDNKLNSKIAKIGRMDAIDLITHLLSHYTCPASCGAACCVGLSVPFTNDDVKRIGKNSSENKAIFKKLQTPKGKYEASTVFKVLPSLPCDFLENGKCRVYKQRPRSCRVFPVNARMKGDALIFRIYLCELGSMICSDYLPFLYTLTKENIKENTKFSIEDIIDHLGDIKKLMYNSFINNIDIKNIGFFVIDNIELLGAFLVWIELHEDELEDNRQEIRKHICAEFAQVQEDSNE